MSRQNQRSPVGRDPAWQLALRPASLEALEGHYDERELARMIDDTRGVDHCFGHFAVGTAHPANLKPFLT
ncbi:MAG: hypothetical protein KAV83_11785 [Desulfobacterales bacterium]|nr:hypothetical protein [Desulfobacterales bacterium]